MSQLSRALARKDKKKKGFVGVLETAGKGFLKLPGPRASIALGKTVFNLGEDFGKLFEGTASITGGVFGPVILIIAAVVGLGLAWQFLT